jgi:methyl-accepting chemotaxis protein
MFGVFGLDRTTTPDSSAAPLSDSVRSYLPTGIAETGKQTDSAVTGAKLAASKAKVVPSSSQRAVEICQSGRLAVEASTTEMGAVKEQVESVAENILALAQQAQAI